MVAGIIGITVLLIIIASATSVTFVGAQQAKTFLTYKDPKGTFTINYPNDWTVKPGNRFEDFLVRFNGPSAFFGIMEPITRHNDPSSLKDILGQFMLAISNSPNFKSVEDIRCDKYVVNGNNKACNAVFTRTVSYIDTNKIVTLVVISEHEGRVYVFRYEALPDNFDAILPTVEKMINSFKILSNTTQALP
jgi:hypothetical protein